MNPFQANWPYDTVHSQSGWWNGSKCAVLENYFHLIDEPALPDENEVEGNIVVIAGKARTGGTVGKARTGRTSAFSHRLLHKLCEKKNRVPLDLVEAMEHNSAKNDDESSCFIKILDRAELFGLIVMDTARSNILHRSDWGTRNRRLQIELDGRRAAIRMPPLDSTLKVDAIADDIKRYSISAKMLETSIYIYEYSYVHADDWEELQGSLGEISDCLRLIEARVLLVDDAMNFIRHRLDEHSINADDTLDLDETEAFLKKQADPRGELEDSLNDLSTIMHRAFHQSERMHEQKVPTWIITDEYHKYYAERAGRGYRSAP